MKPQHLAPSGSELDTIGWTPLIRLARVSAGLRTPIFGKAKYVTDARFPVVDASFPTNRLAPMLTRGSPATLVQQDGKLIRIVSRYDLLQQLIGTR